jgi:hypothetical protein
MQQHLQHPNTYWGRYHSLVSVLMELRHCCQTLGLKYLCSSARKTINYVITQVNIVNALFTVFFFKCIFLKQYFAVIFVTFSFVMERSGHILILKLCLAV